MARSLASFLGGEKSEETGYLLNMGRGSHALLERLSSGDIVVRKTTDNNPGLCLSVFFYRPDRVSGEWKIKKSEWLPVKVEVRRTNDGWDFDGVRHPGLREALEGQNAHDSKTRERREEASSILEPREDWITSYDLVQDGKPGTCPVDVLWQPKGVSRPVKVTCELVSNGTTFKLGRCVDGVVAKVDPEGSWFAKAKEAQPIAALKTPMWRAFLGKNGWFEVRWTLEQAAQNRDEDVVRVSRENVDDLLGVKGKNGVYALRTYVLRDGRNSSDRKVSVQIGLLIERKSGKIRVLWGTGGAGHAIASKEGAWQKVTELRHLRTIFRNAYKALHGLKGTAPETMEQIPAHLHSDYTPGSTSPSPDQATPTSEAEVSA